VNPNGGLNEFIKKDPIRNVDVHRDAYPAPPDITHISKNWAIGTKTFIAETGKVVDGKLDRRNIDSTVKAPRSKTDNISFEPPPAVDRPFQKVFDEMVTRPKYNINAPSTNGWVPFYAGPGAKTVNNRSSVSHNIITHKENDHTPALVVGLLDKSVANMRKGVGEYTDLMRVTAVNKNPDFLKAVETNPDIFKRKNGIFTYLYDSAARFGETKPFKH